MELFFWLLKLGVSLLLMVPHKGKAQVVRISIATEQPGAVLRIRVLQRKLTWPIGLNWNVG